MAERQKFWINNLSSMEVKLDLALLMLFKEQSKVSLKLVTRKCLKQILTLVY